WAGVGAGGSHAVAWKAGGGLWSWGSNSRGQLGDGATIGKNVPTPLTEARIDVAPSSIDYKTVALGAVSSQNITIANKGTAVLAVSALTTGGPDSAVFSLKSGGTCGGVPITVLPAGSCTVSVAFTAVAPGGAKNATLTITSNDPNFSESTVDLSGMVGVQHTLTASVYAGSPTGSGTINPSGAVPVLDGASQTYAVTPNFGYHVVDVTVNGV